MLSEFSRDFHIGCGFWQFCWIWQILIRFLEIFYVIYQNLLKIWRKFWNFSRVSTMSMKIYEIWWKFTRFDKSLTKIYEIWWKFKKSVEIPRKFMNINKFCWKFDENLRDSMKILEIWRKFMRIDENLMKFNEKFNYFTDNFRKSIKFKKFKNWITKIEKPTNWNTKSLSLWGFETHHKNGRLIGFILFNS